MLDLGFGDALALEARHGAAAAARIDAVQSFDHTTGSPRSPGSRRPTRRRATASPSPRSCTTWRPDATLHARQLPHRARVRAGRRLARARPRRQAARRHRRALELLPRRPVRRHGRDRAGRRRRARRGHLLGQQRGQLRPAALGGHGRRPRRRHLRRHDRPDAALDVPAHRERRHGRDAALVPVHEERRRPSRRASVALRARHHRQARGTPCRSRRGCATRRVRSRSSPTPRLPPARTSCAPAC